MKQTMNDMQPSSTKTSPPLSLGFSGGKQTVPFLGSKLPK